MESWYRVRYERQRLSSIVHREKMTIHVYTNKINGKQKSRRGAYALSDRREDADVGAQDRYCSVSRDGVGSCTIGIPVY